MHRNHLVGCAAGITLALTLVWLSEGSLGGAGVLVAALICPVAMVVAIHLLARRDDRASGRPELEDLEGTRR